ncbi:MAG: hypothetical protein ACXAEX_20130 [Promethearchaeota archaeon]|jgi:hypothetical protein
MCSSEEDFNEDTWKNHYRVRDAFQGVYEILNIALDPKSVYYQCGVDNLIALRESLIDLLKNNPDTLELQDILGKIKLYVKKSSFLGDLEKKKQNKERKNTT